MIRRRAPAELDPWIERAKTSLVAAFANGVTKDMAAVSATIKTSSAKAAKPAKEKPRNLTNA